MKLTDLCDDILLKIEDEIKIIRDNKKYKSNYDDFVKIFKDQIKFYKYDTLCDELDPNHPDDVMRTKDFMVKTMDDIEITDFNYWLPLAELDDNEPCNYLNCFDCNGHPTI
jgi:hypothetical protein